ncbi:MAG TPA: phosphatidate cytidylyltransferase [Roseiarcus sp.]|jgi:phosphatidate cytidylyltransferase
MGDPEKARLGDRRANFGLELPWRVAAGSTLMVFALGTAWVGGFPFLAFWLAASEIVVWEWQRLVGGERLWARVTVGALALLAASPFALHAEAIRACLVVLVGAMASGALADSPRRIWAGAGVLYAGALVVGVNLLRASPAYGLPSILWLFAVVWGTDVLAYFGGRLIGGAKLWPSVSPGKTWSGAIVGAVAGALLGSLVAALAAPGGARFLQMTMLGLVVSIVSQLGDLFESAMKRRAGVKDSSRLIPGHGGLMDRLDGFIAATAVAAILAGMRSSGTWIAEGLFQW